MWEWELTMLVRLALALFLGALIGLERERKNRSAGFRTHILVAVGSCVFMLVSISMPMVTMTTPNGIVNNADPGRVAAQVVSGIGFLGAGAILQSKGRIRGLTTAASLWVVSALGLAVGAGLYLISIVGTLLILIVLTYFSKIEQKARYKEFRRQFSDGLTCEEQEGKIDEITDLIGELVDAYGVELKHIRCHENARKRS